MRCSFISVIHSSEAVGFDGIKRTRVVAGENGHEPMG